jgi:hypothetical protein
MLAPHPSLSPEPGLLHAHDSQWPARLAGASVAIAGAIGLWLLTIHARMVLSPAPQEMREGAVVWITRLLLEGRNPYALDELPAATNVYGILYHLTVLPLAVLFGNGFPIHRAVSAAAIAGACVLMHRLLRREGSDLVLAWTGTILFYVSCVYFTGPLARPDGLAVLLSMASLVIVTEPRVTALAFGAGLALALLALVTKISLAFPPFIVAAHMFFFRGGERRRGLAFGVAATVAAVALLAAMNRLYPAYVTLTFAANAQSGFSDAGHLQRQTLDWLVFSLPLTVATAWAVARWTTGRPGIGTAGSTGTGPAVFAFGTAANALVFFIWLGWHPGAHMTYLFQLVTPLLMPAVLPPLSRVAWPRALVAASLPVSLVVSAPYFTWTFERFHTAEATFARLGQTIASHASVLGSTEVAGLLAMGGRPVLDSGQSEYFGEAIGRRTLPGTVPRDDLRHRWESMFASMESSVERGGFDLIVRSRRAGLIPLSLVTAHYQRVETVPVTFAWCGQTWLIDLWSPQKN